MQNRIANILTYLTVLLIAASMAVATFGWMQNIYKLWYVTTLGEGLLRVAGIFLWPLGCVFGYL